MGYDSRGRRGGRQVDDEFADAAVDAGNDEGAARRLCGGGGVGEPRDEGGFVGLVEADVVESEVAVVVVVG